MALRDRSRCITIFFPFIGDTIGGSHLSALSLIKELRAREMFTPIIGLHDHDGAFADYLKQRDYECATVPEVEIVNTGSLFGQFKKAYRAAKPLAAFLKAHDIDLVHINDVRTLYTWFLATKMTGKKLVWHQRTSSSSLRIAALSLFMDAIIVISNYTKQQMRSVARNKARIVNNPITLSTALAHTEPYDYRAHYQLPENTYIIGSVGNLTAQKRPDLILEIAKRLKKSKRLFAFIIVGAVRDAYGREIERRIHEEGLSRQVFLHGAQFPIDPYMKGFDCLLAPALDEGFGRTLIEAFLCRIPVLASAHGGHLDIIQHQKNGILIDPNDADAYVESIMQLSEQGEQDISHILKTARKYALDHFSAGAHADAVESIYAELVKGRS